MRRNIDFLGDSNNELIFKEQEVFMKYNRLFLLFFFCTGPIIEAQEQWSQQTRLVTSDLQSVYCLDTNHCFAGATDVVLKTTNGGDTWIDKAGAGKGVYCLNSLHSIGDTFYAANLRVETFAPGNG